jgi:hypothetical protein
MQCFNHDSAPAVGICKHCNKAICHACLTDTGDGIACSRTCVENVQILNRLIARSRNTASLTNRNAFLTPVFFLSAGAVFTVFGLLDPRNFAFALAMGVLFFILSGLYFVRMRQWVNAAESTNTGTPKNG